MPRFSHHVTLLQAFGEQFWKLYHDLLDYRIHLDAVQAMVLHARFDQLFSQSSGYQQLDEQKQRTLNKREHTPGAFPSRNPAAQ